MRPEMSRQNSSSASGYRSSSITASPHLNQGTYSYPHRPSVSSVNQNLAGAAEVTAAQPYSRSPSVSTALAAARYEEAALQRAELEAVKKENEVLRARVKELEKSLQRAMELGVSS